MSETYNIRKGDDSNRQLVSVLFNGGHPAWIITARWAERPLSDDPPVVGEQAFWPITGHSEERFDSWPDFKRRLDELAAMLDVVLIG